MGIIVARPRSVPASEWPNASNTGVPAGTSLTPHVGNFETTANNEIVEDLDVTDGAIVVAHTDVTVRRCKVTVPTGDFGLFVVENAATDAGTTTIEDCEIDGAGIGGPGGGGGATVVRRVNIHDSENGFHILSGYTVEDCYIHDLHGTIGDPDPHVDGIQTSADVENVLIRHNNFDLATPVGEGTEDAPSAGLQFDQFGDNIDWLVDNNRIVLESGGAAPGAFTIRLPRFDASANNVRVTNNFLGAGVFGYVDTEPETQITEWSGNVDYITGDPVDLP